MARKPSSQWEFGELFSARETRRVLTISQLTGDIRRLLEERVGTVWVSGEITNLRVQASGHAYFSLKDPEAQLSCVLFRGTAVTGRSLLDNGVKVIVQGDLTVYEPRGQYQLVVREMEFQGAGALQAAFEKLKRELDAKGYFSPERKRPLPRFPERIGVVSSATGAAIRDVFHVVQRRNPGLEIVLAPCRVQGDGAAQEIATAIEDLNRWSAQQLQGRGLDAILVTRGGGSLEDLWAFNELVVAEAIYQSALPVVSAVGHEIDFCISDFVADLRAATPSAAAEILTDATYASRITINECLRALGLGVRRGFNAANHLLEASRHRLKRCEPTRLLRDRMQYLDDICLRLRRCAISVTRHAGNACQSVVQRLRRFSLRNELQAQEKAAVDTLRRLNHAVQSAFKAQSEALHAQQVKLDLLSPTHTIARGYSITTDAQGRLLRSINAAREGMAIVTRLPDGTVESEIKRIS